MTTTNHHTYWISIGRNVGAEPMRRGDWEAFQDATERYILRRRAAILTSVVGRGDWEGEPEETCLYLIQISGAEVATLRSALAYLARVYGQDGIGFVGGIGTDTYIGADK